MTSLFTPVAQIPKIHQSIRTAFSKGTTLTYEWRMAQLQQLRRMISENEAMWKDALKKDLHQTSFIQAYELQAILSDVDNAIKNLGTWMAPESRPNRTLSNLPGSGFMYKEPFGVVLIIAPWNYPVQLLLRPLVGAIAAGNAAVIKPSEVAEATCLVFSQLVSKYMDNNFIQCVIGGIPETTELLNLRWDYIFYTGSTSVGKIVYQKAAVHLTPVTLELGGKSPCIVDKNTSLDAAAKRIVWGKMVNMGQSCIAPDYILVHKEVEQKFIEKCVKVLKDFYSTDKFEELMKHKDISRIINEHHTKRIKKLIETCNAEIVYGGKVDEGEKFIQLTLISNPSDDSAVMKEEIFGPVLPIKTFSNVDEVISYVNKGEKPLALYIFSKTKSFQDRILKETSSGAVLLNDTMLHFGVSELPFGGVGHSGIGAYNGKASFDTFTHLKPVFDHPYYVDPSVRYPPYSDGKIKLFRTLSSYQLPSMSSFLKVVAPIAAVGAAGVMYYLNMSKM